MDGFPKWLEKAVIAFPIAPPPAEEQQSSGPNSKLALFPSQALLRHKYLILSGDKNLLIFFWRGSNALKFELLKSFLFQMAFVFTIFII